MKKVLSVVAVAAVSASFVACGPSKEEMEKRDKDRKDSIAAVEKTKQDSIAAAIADQERIAEEQKQKHIKDSTHMADSLANLKGAKKTK